MLKRATVYQGPFGHCFTDWREPHMARQVELVAGAIAPSGARVLDVGCDAGVWVGRLPPGD